MPGRGAVEAPKASTLLGAGAAGSGQLKFLLTVAYVEWLGLDSSPARGHEEIAHKPRGT